MTAPHAPARLRLGPLLRYVDTTSATVWVETDAPATVCVLGREARTWSVHGHHYALVLLEGLEPGSEHAYDVRIDGEHAWPPPGDRFPAPTIRTLGTGSIEVAFGSCRALAPYDADGFASHGADALVALAEAVAAGQRDAPDLLLLLGDQVYADEPEPEMVEKLRARPGVDPEVAEEIRDFGEYTWLYDRSWCEPAVRWLLSTVPNAMMLDDHDLRDDWNSSQSWRTEMTAKPWWRDRVVGALASYWVYQHLGNLAPAQVRADPVWKVMQDDGPEQVRNDSLDAMAWAADADPSSQRWSFARELAGARLVMVDSRCSRSLAPGHRAMLDDAEWRWLEEQLTGDVDHLIVGTSLPWLMTPTVHALEAWNEATAAGAWGRPFAWVAERLRRAVDLEHWAAFQHSFTALSDALSDVATGGRGEPPASILVLSGDVHLSYASRGRWPGKDLRSDVWQLVMSPLRNPLSPAIRRADRFLNLAPVRRAMTWLSRRAGVAAPPVEWTVDDGPWFDNGIATLRLADRRAGWRVDVAGLDGSRQVLRPVLQKQLTDSGG